MEMMHKLVVLLSMDGVGVAPPGPGNAVTLAKTPNLSKLWQSYPHTYLEASGLSVGVPSGIDGNSEVGHMTMGSGKVIFQDLPRIDNAIKNRSFFENLVFKGAFDHVKETGGKLHLMGLIGSGAAHASINHLAALIEYAGQEKVPGNKVFIHGFTDGRDSPTNSAAELLANVAAVCQDKGIGRIASLIGRSFAMDRNRNWQKTEIAYNLLTKGTGTQYPTWEAVINASYKKNITDEFIEPSVIVPEGEKPIVISDNDAVIFFNYRPDRAYQLTYAFEAPDFKEWQREPLKNLFFVGMTEYEGGYPTRKAFPPETVSCSLGRGLAEAGLKQFRIAESEKFPHVTYFFNGKNKDPFSGETRVEVPSPADVETYDQKPAMSQRELTEMVLKKIEAQDCDFILANFAGPDMVAHSGVLAATIQAMEVCDECVGRIVAATLAHNGLVIITADHGNAEEMQNAGNDPDTKHSTNYVPFIFVEKGQPPRELTVGTLADVAPTILKAMNLPIPTEMTGRNLLE